MPNSSIEPLERSRRLIIDLDAIGENYKTIRDQLPIGVRIMQIVKADMYGLSALIVTRELIELGCDIVGVAYVEEAVALRVSGIGISIFVLSASPAEIPIAVEYELEMGIGSLELLLLLEQEARRQKKKVKVHLQCNTGMCRFGCRPEELFELASRVQQSDSLQLEGIMTHLAAADVLKEDFFTEKQMRSLRDVVSLLNESDIVAPYIHCANSATIARFPQDRFNMVRSGAALLGVYPSEHLHQVRALRLAITLKAPITHVIELKRGDTVSYDRTYREERESAMIAVVAIGYADALNWCYSGKAYSLVCGERAAWLGRICMDYMMIDITAIPGAGLGSVVTIFGTDEYGNTLSPESLATMVGSAPYQIISSLGPRIHRTAFKRSHDD